MKKKLCKISGMIGAASLAYYHQNKTIKVSTHEISSEKLPEKFKGFKIAQVSDIHCEKIGGSDQLFLQTLKKENPDIIVITGDVLDSYRNNFEIAYNILAQIAEIAPCYYVSGNHELRLDNEYKELKLVLDKLGIINLCNSFREIYKDGDSIILSGVEDFNYFIKQDISNYYSNHRNMLLSLYHPEKYNILLAHRPEKFFVYSEVGYDLIFSGHAHGGQWNIPFLGRIFSPSQGYFPEYTHGCYTAKNSNMIISQGLGNSSFPMRINNRLELIIVTLI